MRYFNKVRRLALAVSLFAATLGTAHATVPGSNGVIVYETKEGAIMKVAPDGGTPKQIGTGTNPTVSPDGLQVAFTVNKDLPSDDTGQLWVMNIDGTNLRSLGQTPLRPGSYRTDMDRIAWSPDGTQIAYGDDIGREFRVYVCNVSTGCLQAYASPVGTWPVPYELTGDWERLSWSTAGIVGSTNFDNRLIDPTGQRSPVRLPPENGAPLKGASWLPGSSNMLSGTYTSECASTINVDGTDRKQLGSSCMPSSWITVSPDGSSFVSVSTAGVLSTQSLSGQNSKTLATGVVSADWSRAPILAMNMTRYKNNAWPAPTLLGGDARYISQAAVTVMPFSNVPYNRKNRKQAVGISLDGTVYYRQLASTAIGDWSAWTVVPGRDSVASGFKAKHVSIAGANDGSAQVVAVGLDDNVYHAMRFANGTWSGFNPLQAKARTTAIAISGSTDTSPGTAQVIANGFDGGNFFHRVRYADGSWTPWAQQSATLVNTGSLAITADNNGNAYILATQAESGLLRTVRYANGAWDVWSPVRLPSSATGKPIDISLATNSDYNGSVQVLMGVIDASETVWFQPIDNPLDRNSWASPATPPTNLLSNGVSVSVNFSNDITDVTVTQPSIQAQLK